MNVRLTAKGLFDPGTGVAGWSVIIQGSDGMPSHFCGRMQGINTEAQCEIATLLQSVESAHDQGLLPAMSRLEVVTNQRDVIAVLLAMVPSSRCIGDVLVEPAKRITTRTKDFPATVDLVALISRLHLMLVMRVGTIPEVVIAAAAAERRRAIEVAA